MSSRRRRQLRARPAWVLGSRVASRARDGSRQGRDCAAVQALRFAVTSISTRISGRSRPVTTRIAAAGRMSRNTSPQTASTASASARSMIAGTYHVGKPEARLVQRPSNAAEAVARLLPHVLRHLHGGVVVASRPGHEAEVAVQDRAAIAGAGFERRSGRDQAATRRMHRAGPCCGWRMVAFGLKFLSAVMIGTQPHCSNLALAPRARSSRRTCCNVWRTLESDTSPPIEL
jgi:hypothetical protein